MFIPTRRPIGRPDRGLSRGDRGAERTRPDLSTARRGADRAPLRPGHPGAPEELGLGLGGLIGPLYRCGKRGARRAAERADRRDASLPRQLPWPFHRHRRIRAVAERLFNDIQVDQFLLEYDDERAGDFAPLRHVPATKCVVLGLISSKTPALEDPAFSPAGSTRRRGMSHSIASPCHRNAASVPPSAAPPMTEDEERRKLGLVGDVARTVWGA